MTEDGLAYAWGMGSNLQHEDDQCDKKQREGRKVIDASVRVGGGDIALSLHQKQLANKPVLTLMIHISMYYKFTLLFCCLVVHVNKLWGKNWLQ